MRKVPLEISLGLGFILTSPFNNSIYNGKLESDHKCKATKILVKIKAYRKKCLTVLQYLHLSDKNTLTKMRYQ